ncbi:MAG TPA: 16S rRNA (adenine(1518)-N(6)/adenine(1519)-N(6))-dimethyltransferase RsmA, partial [Cytophagaceae bacterium]|nr:16S rRNA (adenine(1518)-N(6)/adenine(1519)-N(6))-dimethyltransferase RsmA [Cytophagaceae bacterium]
MKLNNLDKVKPKKALGQHFLHDQQIAQRIVDSLFLIPEGKKVLEIGPGMGVLTQYLLKRDIDLSVVEIDRESVVYLEKHFPELQGRDKIWNRDFLRMSNEQFYDGKEPFVLIGNLPYNISSPIFFKVMEMRDRIPQMVCMIQKEVAERIAAPHGNKTYGILSVLMQAFYKVEYLFTVNEGVFTPPPKVKSGVIRYTRLEQKDIGCDVSGFFKVVKAGFGTRRKMLRNALKSFNLSPELYE